jgi:hypothetical protein
MSLHVYKYLCIFEYTGHRQGQFTSQFNGLGHPLSLEEVNRKIQGDLSSIKRGRPLDAYNSNRLRRDIGTDIYMFMYSYVYKDR